MRFPICMPRYGPRTEPECLFEELHANCPKPTERERVRSHWISDATWQLVDHRAQLRRRGMLSLAATRRLNRQVKALLNSDRKQRAKTAAETIEDHLGSGNLKEAWRALKGWYAQASDRLPKPCYDSMVKQTAERVKLYEKVPPPGDPIPINVDPFDLDDSVPDDVAIREVVRGMKNGRAGGSGGITAEHIKLWLAGMVEEEKEGTEKAGDCWRTFVKLIQLIWDTGEIPRQMLWMVVVLLPKGGGDFRGIGLLEPFWKVIEVLIDQRLSVIEFHDCLHGFLAGRGTGTAISEVKLTQQLAYMDQVPLYGIFIDLRKAYDAMDRERVFEILVAYGVGPKTIRLLKNFWDNAELVCRASGVFGKPFKAYRGMTQGGPVSPRIFNIMVDAIVREWLRQTFGDEVAGSGLGEEIRSFLAAFYADDGLIQGRDPVLLQSAFDVLIELFERVGLRTNTTKTQVMVCVPGKIRTQLGTDVYNNMHEGFITLSEWKRRRVQCDKCEAYMSASSLPKHREKMHGIFDSSILDRAPPADAPGTTYRAYRSQPVDKLYYHVPGCVGLLASEASLRRHFADRHHNDLVSTPVDGCPPKCEECGLQVTLAARLRGHETTQLCQDLEERRSQRRAARESMDALGVEFTAYGDTLERVEVFKYLGRLIVFDDTDAQAIASNLMKARKSWSRISKVLRADNASPKVCGMFYKATVQAILLYGSETWNLTPTALRVLEGFHLQAARCMTGMMPKKGANNTWQYPSSADVLEKAGLHTIAHYIDVRRQTIAAFIVNRPIFELCMEGERRRGSSANRQFW